jgi:glycosyltransferase involved in cell wall biosynthesis
VREFGRLDDPRARLVVAGKPATAELRTAIETAAARDPRVQLHLREIEDGELQIFLNAADVVVLPYDRILNSGSALLGLSFGRPVLVPGIGAMDELRSEIGAAAVHTFEPPLAAGHLRAALDAAVPDPVALIERLRVHQDWDGIAERTLALYRMAAA